MLESFGWFALELTEFLELKVRQDLDLDKLLMWAWEEAGLWARKKAPLGSYQELVWSL